MKPHLTLVAFISCLFISAITRAKAADADAPVRIVLVGDSTVCNYPDDKPERGWGQYIQGYFDESVKVINLAKSGRSTKTFMKEGLWKKALDEKPQFVLVQLGHNDSHAPEKPEATNAATDYKENLRIYIDESRAIGAKPILVTPMVRRVFREDGKLANELQPYVDAMKQVAAEKQVPLIDLHASSMALVEPLGAAGSADMANKPGDNTHFGAKGAQTMAKLVMNELPSAAPELKSHLKAK
jgi:lysophospholipase L1-like esterase